MGFEPTTLCLEGRCSTPELRPRKRPPTEAGGKSSRMSVQRWSASTFMRLAIIVNPSKVKAEHHCSTYKRPEVVGLGHSDLRANKLKRKLKNFRIQNFLKNRKKFVPFSKKWILIDPRRKNGFGSSDLRRQKVKNKMAKSAAVAKVEKGTALETTTGDDFFGQFEGDGLQNVRPSDLIIPRITILQALSPQVQPKKPEYVQGAQVGDICDVGTGEIFEAPMLFLPVYYAKQWLEWAPRASGKGLVAIHNDNSIIDQCTKDEKGRAITAEGNLISETAQFFGLNLSAEGRRSFLPLSSTQLKKAKSWLTLSTSERAKRTDGSSYVPPIYYRVYQLSTVEESNAQGDWVGWRIERGPKLSEYSKNWQEIATEAKAFRESIAKGEVRGDVGSEDHVESEKAM